MNTDLFFTQAGFAQQTFEVHPIDMYPQQHAAVGGRLFLAHLAGFMETRTQTTGLRRQPQPAVDPAVRQPFGDRLMQQIEALAGAR